MYYTLLKGIALHILQCHTQLIMRCNIRFTLKSVETQRQHLREYIVNANTVHNSTVSSVHGPEASRDKYCDYRILLQYNYSINIISYTYH